MALKIDFSNIPYIRLFNCFVSILHILCKPFTSFNFFAMKSTSCHFITACR